MAVPKKKTSRARTGRRWHSFVTRMQKQLTNRADAAMRLAGKPAKDKKSKVVTVEA